ncbi:MAG TPA: glycogen-binding domain-containing protein [Verrucomicrobiae bacterium]|nr:glycogen-binding domain-containing protein [Verrucomicrobiae bacterium]
MKRNQKAGPSSRAAAIAESEDDIIELKLSAPSAHSVFVAGNFNGWDPQHTPLRKEAGGVWRAFLPLSPGRYEYRLVVDGQWQEDPGARESVPNPHGGRNSVLVVHAAARPAMAEAEEW